MKTIVVQWVPEDSMYSMAMRVIASDHPRFTVGNRFDFGFMSVATNEGYTVVSLPMPKPEQGEVEKPIPNMASRAIAFVEMVASLCKTEYGSHAQLVSLINLAQLQTRSDLKEITNG